MYEIVVLDRAKKQLSKLPQEIKERIGRSIERIRIRPYPHIKRLVGCPYFCLRVGDYRVILDIKKDKLIIIVIEVGHRKKIYKKE